MTLNIKKPQKLLETVYLYDKEHEKNFTIIISTEDAERCNEDPEYASYILQLAKDSQNTQNETQNELELKEDSCWSYKETMALISCYEAHNEHFKHTKNKKLVWETIATELLNLGYEKNAKKCETKWRNLVRTYKVIKFNKNNRPSKFQFFEKIDEILTDQCIMTCNRSINPQRPDNYIQSDHLTATTHIDYINSTHLNRQSMTQSQGRSSIVMDSHRTPPNTTQSQETSTTQSNLIHPSYTPGIKNDYNYDEVLSDYSEEEVSESPPEKKIKPSISEELIRLKINYFKRKEQDRIAKERRKEEKLSLQKRLLEVEEKKVLLLEKYFNNKISDG